VTRCASCRRWLCSDCWQRKVAGEPWCEACIHHLSSAGSNLALASGFFMVSAAVAWWGARAQQAEAEQPSQWWAVQLLLSAILAVFIGARLPAVDSAEIQLREASEAARPPGAACTRCPSPASCT
jgi:hypothetical protein